MMNGHVQLAWLRIQRAWLDVQLARERLRGRRLHQERRRLERRLAETQQTCPVRGENQPKERFRVATLSEVIEKTGTEVFDWLARDAEVPTVTTAACQGDVSILRQAGVKPATTAIPAAGVAIVRGENGGNTHSLHGDGFWNVTPERDGSLELGILTVPDGAEAHLLHPEHGALTITPGTYRIGRQREYAGEWRQVAD